MGMKNYGKKITFVMIISVILYIVVGAIVPFSSQPVVGQKTMDKVAQTTFMSEDIGKERAMIIDQNGDALAERIRLISQAHEKVILSTFEFRSDESGKDVLAALIDAAKRGISVQVLVDGLGALTRMTNNDYFIALSSLENAEIKVYNPICILKPWNLMSRMHDKYMIVDDKVYILGGRNNYDYFLGDHQGHKNYDWDVLIYQHDQVAQHSLQQLNDYFNNIWELTICEFYHDDIDEQYDQDIIEACEELQTRYQNLKMTKPEWFKQIDYVQETLPTHHVELVSNPIHNQIKEPIVYYTITELMMQAEKQVKFHTPYIINNEYMMERLKMVCHKVPEVIMMTNSVANNGNPFGAMEYQDRKDEILATGLQILEYDGGISYHGKCLTIDDRLSAVGSFNQDMRSAYIDTELMLVIDSQEVNKDLNEKMQFYENNALKVIDKDTYQLEDGQIPQSISFFRQVQLWLMQLFIGWLRFLM